MGEYTFLIGIPASGKTTYAVNNLPENSVRVNRDDIREMLMPNHSERWYKHPEMTEREKKINNIIESLKNSFDSIWFDNTNLDWSYLKEDIIEALAQGKKVTVIFMLDSEDLDRCVQRDSLRKRQVGEEKIKIFQERYFKIKEKIASNSELAYIEKSFN